MAEKNYPRIPAKNWWMLRNRFKQSMPPSIATDYLANVLGVKEPAAKNLFSPLRAIGIIDDEGNTTARANRWRLDSDYPEICAEIRRQIYPETLLLAVPDPVSDFNAATQWFMTEASVGEGAAKQMATLYRLLTKADPSEGQNAPASATSPSRRPKRERPTSAASKSGDAVPQGSITPRAQHPQFGGLHINIQLHISPNASLNQIDQIFASIAKHLNLGKPDEESS